jgi:hypothetical protein
MNDANKGVLVEATRLTVEAWLWRWLDGKHKISPVTRERYREYIGKAIAPTLGRIELQKLKPIHVKE